MKRVYIYTHDPMLHMFYTEAEYLELFGDHEYSIEISDDLHDRFLKAVTEMFACSKELGKIHANALKTRY